MHSPSFLSNTVMHFILFMLINVGYSNDGNSTLRVCVNRNISKMLSHVARWPRIEVFTFDDNDSKYNESSNLQFARKDALEIVNYFV